MLPRLTWFGVLLFVICSGPAPARAENLVSLTASPITVDAAAAIPTPASPTPETIQSTPPSPLLDGLLVPSGQAHFLAVTRSGARELSVLSYHTITKTWATLGRVALDGEPTQIRAAPAGFIVQLDRGVSFTRIELTVTKRLLKPVDWLVIVIYLAGMAGIGWLCYRRENKTSTDGFFLAGRRVSWWAAGLSLYATGTSAVSFIAIPAKSFATDCVYLAQNVIGFAGTIYIAFKIVPLIRRLGLTSVYHYLEMRFHPSVRVMSSALCILFQLAGRMSVVLYLPALAIAGVTGIDVVWSIVLMGIITTLYTVLGGMKAVIWTDVIQVIVMIGGGLLAIGFVVHGIDGGIAEFVRIGRADGKFNTFDWRLDLTLPTVWAFLLLELINVPTWPKDQVMMQRVLATKDDREARRSMLALAAIVIPGSVLFYGIGSALYVFYKSHPERLNPLLAVDATFPLFIAAELPAGLTGLIIAGLFAASMSTLSSGINSVATLASVDFYERFNPRATPAGSVRLAEWITILAGLLGTGCAVALSFFNIRSLLDASLQLTAILGGGFAGTYALGMFTRRANWQGALIGTAASIASAYVLRPYVSPILLTGTSIAACIAVGYAASYLFPPPSGSLAGLTIFTPRKTAGAAPAPVAETLAP
ncbi:MAG TPA: sodium:solute symporter [Opitutaceae bacterium]